VLCRPNRKLAAAPGTSSAPPASGQFTADTGWHPSHLAVPAAAVAISQLGKCFKTVGPHSCKADAKSKNDKIVYSMSIFTVKNNPISHEVGLFSKSDRYRKLCVKILETVSYCYLLFFLNEDNKKNIGNQTK
jgi:hypothetical protein